MQTWSFSALGVLGFHENIKGIYNDDENNKDDNNKEKDKNKNNNSDKGISAIRTLQINYTSSNALLVALPAHSD